MLEFLARGLIVHQKWLLTVAWSVFDPFLVVSSSFILLHCFWYFTVHHLCLLTLVWCFESVGLVFTFKSKEILKQYIFPTWNWLSLAHFLTDITDFIFYYSKKKKDFHINLKCDRTKGKGQLLNMFTVHRTCNWNKVNICWVFNIKLLDCVVWVTKILTPLKC